MFKLYTRGKTPKIKEMKDFQKYYAVCACNAHKMHFVSSCIRLQSSSCISSCNTLTWYCAYVCYMMHIESYRVIFTSLKALFFFVFLKDSLTTYVLRGNLREKKKNRAFREGKYV